MKNYNKQNNKGFTLIETMVAVFILTVAMVSLLGLISTSLFNARYSNNEIVANYLVQEAIDYIRNDRDTTAFQQASNPGGGWTNFKNKYNNCLSANGCQIDTTLNDVSVCNSTPSSGSSIRCKTFYYNEQPAVGGFYTYTNVGNSLPISNFKRQITMSTDSSNGNDELDIKVTVEWKNGTLIKSRSSRVSLLNWLQQ